MTALYVVLVVLFLWIECFDAPGLRSLVRWRRS